MRVCPSLAGIPSLLAVVCAGCSSPNEKSTSDDARWVAVHEHLPGALFSISGTSETDVWTVGADAEDGLGPLILHYDGQTWKRLASGEDGNLWWTHVAPDGDVYFGGEGGMILRYRGGSFERLKTPSTLTVYGIWAAGRDDVWAVGGAGSTPSGGFAWHYDGENWSGMPVPESISAAANIWKVTGTRSDDVWFCGDDGALLHWNGADFTQIGANTSRTLFTCHAVSGRVVAVGGAGNGVLVESSGSAFRELTEAGGEPIEQLIGVWMLSQDEGYAAGVNDTVLHRTADGWKREATGHSLAEAMHGVWADPAGGIWLAGGRVLSSPFIDGTLLYKGRRDPRADSIEE